MYLERFGRLRKIGPFGKVNYHLKTLCICDCGKFTIVYDFCLYNGNTRSCGCLQREAAVKVGKGKRIHGITHTKFNKVWKGIKQRCYNPNNNDYNLYGARGIKVCRRWHEFLNFKEDMHLKYIIRCLLFGERDTTLDRIDNDGDYTPENCRWASVHTQVRNSRRIKPFVGTRISDGYSDNGLVQVDFAGKYGLSNSKICSCLRGYQKTHKGWRFSYINV